MPRRPIQTANDTKSAKPIRVEQQNIWQQIKTFCLNPRTRIVCGIILLAIALLLLVSYISFFFTGESDASMIASPGVVGGHLVEGDVLQSL